MGRLMCTWLADILFKTSKKVRCTQASPRVGKDFTTPALLEWNGLVIV